MKIGKLEVFRLRACQFHSAGVHIWWNKTLVKKWGTETIRHKGPWSMPEKVRQ